MKAELSHFSELYTNHVADRQALGIPPLPLSATQTEQITKFMQSEVSDPKVLVLHGQASTEKTLEYLLRSRVPPGVYPSSKVKANFLGEIVKGKIESPYINKELSIKMLGEMGGGSNVEYLLDALKTEDFAKQAAEELAHIILISNDSLNKVTALAEHGNPSAVDLLKTWAEARWFGDLPPVEMEQTKIVVRLRGEINTDFLSPAQEAGTRDDIPLHALKILSTSPNDVDFIGRIKKFKESGHGVVCVGDVMGTGSSRKSASNSLIWWIGEDIPCVPNKKRGGFLLASKIAPIFFNTMRGCGAIPVRCQTSDIEEGEVITISISENCIKKENGKKIADLKVEPRSILNESRVGGRNNLIIGRQLTVKARQACEKINLAVADSAVPLLNDVRHSENTRYTLAQKLVGKACGKSGILPSDYCEPKAHLVFSQDTTGKMTQQELQELACLQFEAPTIQSFCHTAAGPKSKDSTMQFGLGDFIQNSGGIDLRPGDGVIHTNGNRFLLPYFVGTGGDSHTRFPIGLSFPAGSDLVAFAASQGYFPLDMPESVLASFTGKPKLGITVRDLVNSIPYTALKEGKLNLEKGDQKKNMFSDRILEISGLEYLTVQEAYKLTDTSAERSSAGSTFSLNEDRIIEYVENNLTFLKDNFSQRHPAKIVSKIIQLFEEWMKNPEFFYADDDCDYSDRIDINLEHITEPLLAAPNDPDKIISLSEAAGTHINEVFIGSCMTDITDFRAAAHILKGMHIPHKMKLWTVPPDRESFSALSKEGVLSILSDAGANIHVPGCSLCMGNQAQVADHATVLSTSTRNFDNRMGKGAKVYLGSAHVAVITALLTKIPTLDEYMACYKDKIQPNENKINEPLKY